MNLKKPNFWAYKKPNIYAYLLFPFSLLINLYNHFKKKSKPRNFSIKTICVGNIYLGGTGKTSLCITIKNILEKENIRSCFIKKFYKNQLDEQRLLKKNGKLFTSNNRINALEKAQYENYDCAILDDGLQDTSIQCNTKFVCFNNINWIGNGMTIPSGPLREKINSLKNYEHVFLNGNLEDSEFIEKEIFKINPKINIHIGEYFPTNLKDFNNDNKYIVFSGIGNHKTFIGMIKKNGLNVLKDIEFPDHYNYSNDDINKIIEEANKFKCNIITTEKDYLRINNPNLNKIKFIKIKLKILDEEKLIKSILNL